MIIIKLIAKVDERFDSKVFLKIIYRFNIDENLTFESLSLGEIKIINLAIGLAINPDILFLDEVTSNFDIVTINIIRSLLLEYIEQENKTLVIATNDLDDVEMIADYVLFLEDANVLEFDSIERMKERYQTQSIKDLYIELLGEK